MTRSQLLQVRDLVQEFTVRGQGGVRGGVLQAVAGVGLDLWPGETLSVVGETGSGKSTLARSIMQAPPPKSGEVVFQGVTLGTLRGAALRDARRSIQMIFQDPYTSLDPLWPVARIVAEPLIAAGVRNRGERRRRVGQLLEQVGLDLAVHGRRRARELSGGQCQRVAIARALAASPALIIADEAVSSLDVLVQAQVLNLLEGLRTSLGLSYLFIAHDLALVKQVSDRVAVMYLGRLCEVGPADEVYAHPRHPYTVELLDAVPRIEQDQRSGRATPRATRSADVPAEAPSPVHPPSGCRFRTRCPRAQVRCARGDTAARARAGGGVGAPGRVPLPDRGRAEAEPERGHRSRAGPSPSRTRPRARGRRRHHHDHPPAQQQVTAHRKEATRIMTDEFGIAGKTLLVTGSGRNLGKAIVLEFAARGANVVVNSRSNAAEAQQVAAEAEALGGKAIVVLGDAAEKSTVLELKARAEEAFGQVDIYVSNAARRLHKDFWETTDEDWHRYLNQQLTASWYLAKAFAPGMRERGWGRILHMNGPDGWSGGPTRLPHSTAKGGLRTFTKSLARSLGPVRDHGQRHQPRVRRHDPRHGDPPRADQGAVGQDRGRHHPHRPPAVPGRGRLGVRVRRGRAVGRHQRHRHARRRRPVGDRLT